jgi:hypothetical protein
MTLADVLNGLSNFVQFLVPAALIAWADRRRKSR